MQRAEETIFYTIESTIKTYRKFAQANIRKVDPTITLDQSMLLMKLMDHPDISQKELARLVFKDVASVTRMIELLVNTGFLTRIPNPENRRRNILTVTPKAKRVLRKIDKVVAKNRTTALEGISEKQINQCKKCLELILDNL